MKIIQYLYQLINNLSQNKLEDGLNQLRFDLYIILKNILFSSIISNSISIYFIIIFQIIIVFVILIISICLFLFLIIIIQYSIVPTKSGLIYPNFKDCDIMINKQSNNNIIYDQYQDQLFKLLKQKDNLNDNQCIKLSTINNKFNYESQIRNLFFDYDYDQYPKDQILNTYPYKQAFQIKQNTEDIQRFNRNLNTIVQGFLSEYDYLSPVFDEKLIIFEEHSNYQDQLKQIFSNIFQKNSYSGKNGKSLILHIDNYNFQAKSIQFMFKKEFLVNIESIEQNIELNGIPSQLSDYFQTLCTLQFIFALILSFCFANTYLILIVQYTESDWYKQILNQFRKNQSINQNYDFSYQNYSNNSKYEIKQQNCENQNQKYNQNKDKDKLKFDYLNFEFKKYVIKQSNYDYQNVKQSNLKDDNNKMQNYNYLNFQVKNHYKNEFDIELNKNNIDDLNKFNKYQQDDVNKNKLIDLEDNQFEYTLNNNISINFDDEKEINNENSSDSNNINQNNLKIYDKENVNNLDKKSIGFQQLFNNLGLINQLRKKINNKLKEL